MITVSGRGADHSASGIRGAHPPDGRCLDYDRNVFRAAICRAYLDLRNIRNLKGIDPSSTRHARITAGIVGVVFLAGGVFALFARVMPH